MNSNVLNEKNALIEKTCTILIINHMKKTKFIFFFMLCGIIPHLYGTELQQPISVSGVVVDAANEPLPGVTIIIQGTTQGTNTDADGQFTITVPGENSVLQVSYIGFTTQTIVVGNRRTLRIVLEETSTLLDEVVVVAYGQQKKVSVTAAISTIQTKELKQSSAANLSNALAGRLPGLTTMQTSGQPGNDIVNLYVRGRGTTNQTDPLIMIDGIPRSDISTLDPNEIASVSILKDASATAVFGVRGANGVILFTTRRGSTGKTELSISADHSLQQFIVNTGRIHSWEFAELRNQASRNDQKAEPYTPYMIDMYKSGADRVFFPDRDVWHDYFRNWSPQSRVNMNLNGGSDDLRYFLNVGYIGQGGMMNTESKSALGYDPSFRMDRYNFRANVDYDITKSLTLSINLGSSLEKMNSPQTFALFSDNLNSMVGNVIGNIWATPPTDPGPLTVGGYSTIDGIEVPVNQIVNQSGEDRNTYGEINRRGYRQETSTLLNSSIAFDWKLDFITKGLSTKVMMAYDTKARTILQGVRSYDCYSFNIATSPSEQSYYTTVRTNQDESINLQPKTNVSYYYLNLQYSINYARQFGLHNVTAMALFQRDNWQNKNYSSTDLPYNMIGLVGRATYGYDDRYLAEVNLGYNGSEQFAPNNRFGFFPAFSLGWVVSNEGFLKDNVFLSTLKLRASYGKVGNDKMGDDRFLYISDIYEGAGGVINTLGRGRVVTQRMMGNESIQWEIAEKQNFGLDFQLWRSFSLSFDIFKEKRDHVLIKRGTVPELQGVNLDYLPRVNMGIVDNHGYEFEAGYSKQFNSDLTVGFKGNYAFNRNKIVFTDEAKLSDEYAYQYRRTGFPIGQQWGYRIDYSNGNGYINTQQELDNLPEYNVGGTPRLGDFIYIDTNGDGVIDEKDLVPMGYNESVPEISFGFSGNVNYKLVDFSFQFTGISRSSQYHAGGGVTEFGYVGFYTEWHKHAWTEERYLNGEKIRYPALSTAAGSSIKRNDHFLFDRTFLRLKTIELGYNLPQKWIKPAGMSRVRAYISGYNLLTLHKYPVRTVDPEQNSSGTYPLTKMVNFGLNVVF